eukprot:48889-Prymnesium_polylepis.1
MREGGGAGGGEGRRGRRGVCGVRCAVCGVCGVRAQGRWACGLCACLQHGELGGGEHTVRRRRPQPIAPQRDRGRARLPVGRGVLARRAHGVGAVVSQLERGVQRGEA